jgi:hypothetical protein
MAQSDNRELWQVLMIGLITNLDSSRYSAFPVISFVIGPFNTCEQAEAQAKSISNTKSKQPITYDVHIYPIAG